MLLSERIVKDLERELPLLVFRNELGRLIPGLNPRTLANFDAIGLGPKERVLVGRKVAYPRQSFLEWLRGRIQVVDNENQ